MREIKKIKWATDGSKESMVFRFFTLAHNETISNLWEQMQTILTLSHKLNLNY